MLYGILIFILLCIGIIITSISCGKKTESSNTQTVQTQTDTESKQGKGADRNKIKARLTELAQSKPPKSVPGAMCYEMVAPPIRNDYICLKCGKKTLYVAKEHERLGDRVMNKDIKRMLIYELEACRRIAGQFQNPNIKLDESRFCFHCSPDAKQVQLGIIVKYSDSETPHQIWGLDSTDCSIIMEFLKGSDSGETYYGTGFSLKSKLKRLEELLGVKAEAND